MNELEETKANDLRAYPENEEGAEVDDDEVELNAEEPTGFGACNPVECDPQPEVEKNHPFIATEWNKNKIGIDGPCNFLSDTAPVHKKCSRPKGFFLRHIRYRASNAMAIWRLVQNYPDIQENSELQTIQGKHGSENHL